MSDNNDQAQQQTTPSREVVYERDPDFTALYANNVTFEPSIWDLKLIFGLLEQNRSPTMVISQHTAMSIPWTQAKLLDYWLRLTIAHHEKINGPIHLPERIMPVVLPPAEQIEKGDPTAQEMFEMYKKIHAEVFGF